MIEIRKPRVVFPKLTTDQCHTVLAWVSARLRPLADVLAELERPEVLALLDSMNAPRLDPVVKDIAPHVTLAIGGGNGGVSWKPYPSYVDIDVFWLTGSTLLSDHQVSQLRSLLNRRIPEEVIAQRAECTIEGVAYSQDGFKRHLDVGKLGTLYNNVLWSIPNRCWHCQRSFNDGRFVVKDGRIVHESCL